MSAKKFYKNALISYRQIFITLIRTRGSLNAVSGMMNLETSSSLMLNALNAISPGEDSYETANFPFNKTFSFPLNDATKKLPVRDGY